MLSSSLSGLSTALYQASTSSSHHLVSCFLRLYSCNQQHSNQVMEESRIFCRGVIILGLVHINPYLIAHSPVCSTLHKMQGGAAPSLRRLRTSAGFLLQIQLYVSWRESKAFDHLRSWTVDFPDESPAYSLKSCTTSNQIR